MSDELPAGDFSPWIEGMLGAIRGAADSDVPCAGCTACCTASQFIHIAPDETDTLAHVPRELLFPAPRAPRGHVLMGYDSRGHCPMLVENECSIYAYRPRTCRTYDCRVFAATGVEIDEPDKELIAQRARRWRFSYPSVDDRARHDAALAAGAFLAAHRDALPDGAVPSNATQFAVLAIELSELFAGRVTPEIDVVRAELSRRMEARDAR